MLRKTIVISFICIFLCSNTEIGQLLKLTNLIEHFTNHHEEFNNHNISLLDFIIVHYGDEKHDSDNKENNHQNLPFKTINSNVNTVLAFENHKMFSFRKPNNISVKRTVPFSPDLYISSVFASIWLPPKLS